MATQTKEPKMGGRSSAQTSERQHEPSIGVKPESVWIKVFEYLEKEEHEKVIVRKRSRTEWHNIRIFVSSTFKDFKHEREVLIKQVFQDLRLWCEKHRLRLIDIDLRWGIPNDKNDEEKLEICLDEVDRCWRENGLPYFINLTSSRSGWVPGEKDIRENILEKYSLVYGLSVTEMEIVRGAFRKANPNAIFLLRDESFLKELTDKDRYPAFQEKDPSKQRAESEKLKELKKHIKRRFDTKQVLTYKCHYKGFEKFPIFEYEPEDIFSKTVLDFFKQRISLQYPDDEYLPEDEFMKARQDHDIFVEFKGEGVQGRDNMIDKMMTHLNTDNSCCPLILFGDAGSGKSAVMALAVKELKKKMTQGSDERHLFHHFVGAVPNSTNLQTMLCRLLLELDVIMKTTMPESLQEACALVYGVLQNPNTRPVIIMIDAINQFEQTTEASLVSWLPPKLAPQVRCIVSVISKSEQLQRLSEREPKANILEVGPLTQDVCEKIIAKTLATYNKQLTKKEMDSMLKKTCVTNPLWLSVACEELRVYGQFRERRGTELVNLIPIKIEEFPDDVTGILGEVLDRLQREGGKEIGHLIEATLCLLEVSKTGLLEDELLELLGNEVDREKDVKETLCQSRPDRLPAMKWALVLRAIKRFLRPFGKMSEGRLDFYHRSISKIVREKFLDVKNDNRVMDTPNSKQHQWHKKLADYFFASSIYDRKVEELPYHLIKLKDLRRLTEFLSEWETMDKLFDPDLSTTLFSYWRQCGDEKLKRMRGCYCRYIQETNNIDKLIKVASLLMQAGDYTKALKLADKASKLNSNILHSDSPHDEQLVNIYTLKANIYHNLSKIIKVVSQEQLQYIQPCIEYCKKAINVLSKQTAKGEEREKQMKLGKMKLLLAFSLSQTEQIIRDPPAAEECKRITTECIEYIKMLGDMGSAAEAMMILAMPYWRSDDRNKQIKIYQEAWAFCYQTYGRYHVLSARIQHNLAIAYDDMYKSKEAYECFKESFLIKYFIYGPEHKLTKKALNQLLDQDFKPYHDENRVLLEAKSQ